MAWFDETIISPEVAGVAGSVLGLLNAPGKNWRERAFNFGAGLGAALFLAPIAQDYFGVVSRNGKMAIAFVIGLVGMNLLAKGIAYVKTTSFGDLINAIRNRQSPPKDPN